MTSPIELNTTTFYEVEDYGSGMTPFYTNLALWVGGMVLIALLKQEVDEDEKVKKFTLNQAYFGRQILFIILSVVQSRIICLGDLYLLKVQCVHPGLFILTGVIAGLIYLSLIYAITAAFKHHWPRHLRISGYHPDSGLHRNLPGGNDGWLLQSHLPADALHLQQYSDA